MSDGIERTEKTLIDQIGKAIFSIRWGLVPMYLGLWIAMVAYCVHFFIEIVNFVFSTGGVFNHTSTEFLLWILSLIDVTMIGNLVVMTTVGGFSTFVKEYDFSSLSGKPRWMNGLDSSTLKIKMSMSLVGVSAIHLLKIFMEAHSVTWDEVGKAVVIHVVFIGTTLAFTLNAKLLHSHTPAPSGEVKGH